MKQHPVFTKPLILCFVFGLTASVCLAQTPLSFGVKGGLNFATLFGDTYSSLGFRTGIILGGTVEMPLKDKISLQSGLLFSQEGARNANYDFSSFSTVIYDQKLKYNYVNIPILIRYHLWDQLSLLGGLQLGVGVGAKEVRKVKSGEPSFSDQSAGTRNLSERIKLIYPSLTVGAAYPISDKLTAQAQIFSSIFDNVKRNAGDSEGTYPLIFQFTVNYDLFQKEIKGLSLP